MQVMLSPEQNSLPEQSLSSFILCNFEILECHRILPSLVFKKVRELYENVQYPLVPKYLKGYINSCQQGAINLLKTNALISYVIIQHVSTMLYRKLNA